MHLAPGNSCVPCSRNVHVRCSRCGRGLCSGSGSVPHYHIEKNKDEQEDWVDVRHDNLRLLIYDQVDVWQGNKQRHEDKEEEKRQQEERMSR